MTELRTWAAATVPPHARPSAGAALAAFFLGPVALLAAIALAWSVAP